MSKRAPQVSVLTANRLTDGTVVFLAPDGSWAERIEKAAVARSVEEAAALQAQGARDAARNMVVEPYLAELTEIGAHPVPTRMRERVRVDGPSVLAGVRGYVPPSGRSPPHRLRGEGRGEGQPHTPASVQAPAAHPSPLPATAGRGEPRAAPVEA